MLARVLARVLATARARVLARVLVLVGESAAVLAQMAACVESAELAQPLLSGATMMTHLVTLLKGCAVQLWQLW